jgi:23S rRNA pseudouridine1911/1915/1917 synthase
MNIKIVFEDDALLIVSKPCGLNSDEQVGYESVEALLKNKYKKQQNVFPVLMHRLDRHTSGLILISKKRSVTPLLQRMMEQRRIKKTYLAVVEGNIHPDVGMIKSFLLKNILTKKAEISETKKTDLFKDAQLKYKTIEIINSLSLLEVELLTGRYHQIRAQLAYLHHPVVGDKLYGSTIPSFIQNGIALHAYSLIFTHPVTHQKLKIIEWPDIKGCWKNFKRITDQ